MNSVLQVSGSEMKQEIKCTTGKNRPHNLRLCERCNKSPVIQSTQKQLCTGCWWLTPVILATYEAEIRRIAVQVQGQSGK
jgi:hypothetical protein